MPQLNWALRAVIQRVLTSPTPARFGTILIGRSLSHSPPFLDHIFCVLLLRHLNAPTTSMTHRLHTSVTMWSFSGIHCGPFPNEYRRHSPWIPLNIIAQNNSWWLPKHTYLAMTRRSQQFSPPAILERENASGMRCVTLTRNIIRRTQSYCLSKQPCKIISKRRYSCCPKKHRCPPHRRS